MLQHRDADSIGSVLKLLGEGQGRVPTVWIGKTLLVEREALAGLQGRLTVAKALGQG
jgi:hypothetical protein